MAQDHSFDIVSRIDLQEVANAVNITLKEIRNRFDFKNSRADILVEKERLVLVADDDFKVRALRTALEEKLARRKVPLRALSFQKVEDGPNRTVKQEVLFQAGIPVEKAREIVKIVKELKLKVQASILADQVRIRGVKKDDLQVVIRHLRETDLGIDMQFTNYR